MIDPARIEESASLVAMLRSEGVDGVDAARAVGISRATIRAISDRAELGVVSPIPREVPPKIARPRPRKPTGRAEVSATFIARLRAEYLQVGDDRTKLVGSLDDVREWLAGLKPSMTRKRA